MALAQRRCADRITRRDALEPMRGVCTARLQCLSHHSKPSTDTNLCPQSLSTASHATAVRQLPVRCSCRKKAQRGSRAMRWPGKSEVRATRNSGRQEEQQHQQRRVSPKCDNLTPSAVDRRESRKPVVFPPPRENDGLDLVERGRSEATTPRENPDSLTAGVESWPEAIRQSTNLESRLNNSLPERYSYATQPNLRFLPSPPQSD